MIAACGFRGGWRSSVMTRVQVGQEIATLNRVNGLEMVAFFLETPFFA
jgi:hypothetical protein